MAGEQEDAAVAETPFLDGYLPYLLGHASFVMNKDFDRFVLESGITPLEWRVLASLTGKDALTIGELTQKVVTQQPTLTKAAAKMEEAGLVSRSSDVEDLRKTIVRLTPKGRKLAELLIERACAHERRLLDAFSDEEVISIRRVLQSLVHRQRPVRLVDTI